MPPDTARPITVTERRSRLRPDRPWSPLHPNVTEAQVAAAIDAADIRDLARAIDAGAFRGEHGPNGFTCPRCYRWTAEITTDCLWWCGPCGHTGTRFELVALVRADALAAISMVRPGEVV